MRRLVCALAFVLIARPAWGQGSEGEPAASIGSLASGLIGEADAEGVFDIVPAEHEIAMRHTRSGLVCRMDPNGANRLIIFPEAARGEDVACETTNGHATIKLYATRFSFHTTMAEQISGSAAALRQHYPDAQPFQMSSRASMGGLPPNQTAHFLVRESGVQQYTRVSVAMIRGWVFKLRYTAPAASDDAARQAALAADRIWVETLSDIAAPR